MLNKEEIQRITECAENDKEFALKFTAAVRAKNADEAIRLAAEKGFKLTAEDFAFNGNGELDRKELENVAGGVDRCKNFSSGLGCGFWLAVDLWLPEIMN